jgi:predicted RecA/RadA family phage recombinase
MNAVFVQDGDSIVYTPSVDIAAGTVVVQGDLVGVAKLDIAAGELGSLSVTGIFEMPKMAGPSTAITIGTKLYWQALVKQVTLESADGTYMGKAVSNAGDNDATVRVKLTA